MVTRYTAICLNLLFSATLVLSQSDVDVSSQPTVSTPEISLEEIIERGNPARGAIIFSSPTQACLSCHQVGVHGGQVGPELSQIAKQRPFQELVASLWNPQGKVEDRYRAIAILLADGSMIRGYRVSESDEHLVIRDYTNDAEKVVEQSDIEAVKEIGSLMPTGLMDALSTQEQYDLLAFLNQLGTYEKISLAAIDTLFAHGHSHHPEAFDMDRAPLNPSQWKSWQHHVNRDRVYDYYRKQARHFRDVSPQPVLLAEYQGLDGGKYGHWGNQSEPVWADGRWSKSYLGSLQSGVFHGEGISVARGLCVSVGRPEDAISVCFDPDTLTYPRVWKNGFVSFSDVRHGFMNGVRQSGETLEVPVVAGVDSQVAGSPEDYQFLGLYRDGDRVIFAYQSRGVTYLDEPTVREGKFARIVAPIEKHPAKTVLNGGAPRYPQTIITQGSLGEGAPYAIDTIGLPFDNPWQSLIYVGGHDFMSDGSVMLCTMQGDVWHGQGIDEQLQQITWRKFASGLHQPLGLYINGDQVYVQGRDQITRLHDLNDDGEADYYEAYSRALATSKSGHDFTCGLQRDASGRFYTASGLQGVMRISSDGQQAEVLATGLRNSDGIGLSPDGLVTIPSSEGDWMPASMIAALRPEGAALNRFEEITDETTGLSKPFFGRPGTNLVRPPEIPMLYLPRGLDNSSGGQVFISTDKWGPVQGKMVHLSFGGGRAFLLLKDEFDDWIQGAVVPIAGELASGAHRGRFHPIDGQLYVSGMAGWGTYTTDDGCLQRIRYTGNGKTQLPLAFHVHENGIRVQFSELLDEDIVTKTKNHFAQAWNYRYSGAYGSPEYSHRQIGLRGHDVISIQSASILSSGREIFLEMRDLQLVNQLHLLIRTNGQIDHDLFLTVNRMDKPFTQFDGYRPYEKVRLPHPMLADLQRPMVKKRNPYGKPIPDAKEITISAAKNLMFDQQQISVKPKQVVRLTFKNPDAVPHNWALVQQGSLEEIGMLCNQLITDPEAVANQYIPESKKILAFTDIVEPFSEHTIYFRAPEQPGRYPYLCTFPGHWMVMNGWLNVISE